MPSRRQCGKPAGRQRYIYEGTSISIKDTIVVIPGQPNLQWPAQPARG